MSIDSKRFSGAAMQFLQRVSVPADSKKATDEPNRAKFTHKQALAWAIESADNIRAGEYFTREELMDSSITEPPKRK